MKVPCTIMRGGTSKGIILRAETLPSDPAVRDEIILKIFGSPDRRQINGIAGADPLTSKLALISPPSRPDADIDYTFADVLIDKPVVDYSGYCGNVTSAVAVYAVDEGFVRPIEPMTTVRIHNTNTHRIIKATLMVKDGHPLDRGDVAIAGVPGTAAPIYLDFADTAGSISGKLLPAGVTVELQAPDSIHATICDVGNPMIFVRAEDFAVSPQATVDELNANTKLMEKFDQIRRQGALYLDLIRDGQPISASIPSVAIVGSPADYVSYSTGEFIRASEMDFWSREIFIGSIHKAFGVSETVCAAVAALIPGSIVQSVTRAGAVERGRVRIGHPSGVIEAEAAIDIGAQGPLLRKVSVVRTARRILDGQVYV
jgi:methylitaconate Delta-isomerase